MVSEALSVALGRIPPPRAEMSVKALAELKRAVEDPNREQLREISQRLSQVETSLFSEGNGEEGGMLYASPPIAHKSVSSRSPQPRDFTPIPPQPVQDRKWGGANAKDLASRYAKARKGGESNTLAATGSRNSAKLPTAPSGISPASLRDSLGLEKASRFTSLVSRRRRQRQRCGSGLKYEILCPRSAGSSSDSKCFEGIDPGNDGGNGKVLHVLESTRAFRRLC